MTTIRGIGVLLAAFALPAAASPSRVKCRDGSVVAKSEGCKLHGGLPGEVMGDRDTGHSANAVKKGDDKAGPAQDSLPPTQRAEDRPAHESPYSAFGAPHARRPEEQGHRKSGARMHCKDGTTQTQGQKAGEEACAKHGGVN